MIAVEFLIMENRKIGPKDSNESYRGKQSKCSGNWKTQRGSARRATIAEVRRGATDGTASLRRAEKHPRHAGAKERQRQREREYRLDGDGGSPRESAAITRATRMLGAGATKRRWPSNGGRHRHGRCATSTGARHRDGPRNAPTQ
jgi:hypothetical protein